MGATSSREVEESRQTLLQRKAMGVLEARTDRVALVLERVHDPAAELAALQCADYLGLQTVLRVDHAEKHRQVNPLSISVCFCPDNELYWDTCKLIEVHLSPASCRSH